jgi:pilus assembly protein CpaB
MHVDVLITGNPPVANGAQTGVLCRTVLQDIEVLSAGQKIEKNVEGKPESVQVVNLLVSPNQAEVLSLASDQTRVQLVLRNPLDTNERPTSGTSLASLFGQAVKAANTPSGPAAPRAKSAATSHNNRPGPVTIEVFNGTKRSEERIESPEK